MFHVRPESGEPIYCQLMRQIKHAVTSGVMNPGDQMPTVRDLAARLVINPNTVARACRELVREGVLTATQGGEPSSKWSRNRWSVSSVSGVWNPSFARRYFGNTNPIGKTIQVEIARADLAQPGPRKITLVFHDLPENSHPKYDVLLRLVQPASMADVRAQLLRGTLYA
jgi:DNA-binding transcriptional MocR family regulator